MNNNLDDQFTKTKKLGLFSLLSFSVGMFLTLRMVYSILLVPDKIGPNDELNNSQASNFHYLTFLVIAGAVLALISVVKKEDNHWVKMIGIFLNILWFCLMVIGVIMTN